MFKIVFVPKIDFIENLKTSFNNFDQAFTGVKEGHYWGVAAIQYNFTQAVKNKYVVLLKVNLLYFCFKDY
jgi:hypothetical protein